MPYEAEEILRKEIVYGGSADKRYWRYHTKGNYTVNTGYKIGMQISNMMRRKDLLECSEKKQDWWKNLSSMKLRPKLKNFWWQVAWNILPMEGNLGRRHILVTSFCYLCGYFNASTIHAIFLCNCVRKTWKEIAVLIPDRGSDDIRPIEFIEELYHLNPTIQKDVITAVA